MMIDNRLKGLYPVTNKEIFKNSGKNNFADNGLFCEKVFGPVKNNSCKCGKLNNPILHKGKRCDKCEVLCESNELRLSTSGYIELPFNVIKKTKYNEIKHVVSNFDKYKNTLFDPNRNDLNITQSRYIGICQTTNAVNIYDERRDSGVTYLPLRITGIYSFILALKFIAIHMKHPDVQELFDKQYLMSYIKVIPPGIRPINIDYQDNKKVRITPVNKIYRSLINLNLSNKILLDTLKIDEEDIFNQLSTYIDSGVIDNSADIFEHYIVEYDTITSRYQYYVDQTYDLLQETISGKYGFIRYNLLGKTIDFSARTVICCDPSLEAWEIGVGKKILYKLWILHFGYYLINVKNVNVMWCLDNVFAKNYEDVKELFDEFLDWFYSDGEVALCGNI